MRLPRYDYAQTAVYFVTFCTEQRQRILCRIAEEEPPAVYLTNLGRVLRKNIDAIPEHYPGVQVVHYAIMPDHVHLLLALGCVDQTKQNTKLSTIVGSLKAMVTRQTGQNIWQRSYYDHVIRNQKDFEEIYYYIGNNPRKWLLDGKG